MLRWTYRPPRFSLRNGVLSPPIIVGIQGDMWAPTNGLPFILARLAALARPLVFDGAVRARARRCGRDQPLARHWSAVSLWFTSQKETRSPK